MGVSVNGASDTSNIPYWEITGTAPSHSSEFGPIDPESPNTKTQQGGPMVEAFLYPTLTDVLAIHRDVVDEDTRAEPGIRSSESIDSALRYVSDYSIGRSHETIHERAAHLMRLLVAEHPFVDGNKRTALGTVVVFYDLNGYDFDYEDESVRDLLGRFATDVDSVDMEVAVTYFREHARPAEE